MQKVYSVIVTYNPVESVIEEIVYSLFIQKSEVVIVNNSTADFHLNINNVKVIELHQNYGLARAQNVGIQYAITNGADFILQLDQDSVPSENMIEQLLLEYNNLLFKGYKVGQICAWGKDKSLKADYNISGKEIANSVKVFQTMSSGSLFPKKVFEDIGLMDEKLFIDCVDYEYCWRMNRFGYSVFIARNARLFCHCGEKILKILNVFNIHVNSPLRRYYLFRNVTALTFRNYTPFYWKISENCKNCLRIFVDIFYLDNKRSRFFFSVLGIIHALSGKTGKISDKWLKIL